MKPVTQDWTHDLPMMMQTVLLTAIRGPDGIAKYGEVKMLLRWYRRCVLRSSLDGGIILCDPGDPRGGSFTGPSFGEIITLPSPGKVGVLKSVTTIPDFRWETVMDEVVGGYLKAQDALPFHFQAHFMHAAEIVGYKHPDERVRGWWCRDVYARLAHALHLHPETEAELDKRLGDTYEGWLERADVATLA